MKHFLLDTNCILRFLLNDNHSQALKVRGYLYQANLKKITIYVSVMVFVEVQYALEKLYGFKRDEVVKKIDSFLNLSFLQIEKRDILLSALHFYLSSRISFVDAFLLSEAKLTGKALLTFDKKLSRLAKA